VVLWRAGKNSAKTPDSVVLWKKKILKNPRICGSVGKLEEYPPLPPTRFCNSVNQTMATQIPHARNFFPALRCAKHTPKQGGNAVEN
jgi:hypothetical protein